MSQVRQRNDVSDADKKQAVKQYGHVEYADEKNKKYPLDAEHVVAAWDYINMAKNEAKYSPAEVKTMKARIRAAMKRHGHEVSEPVKKSLDDVAQLRRSIFDS